MLPFGNRTVIETITGQQLTRTRLLNGLQPACNPAFAGGTGRFPQVSGLKITYTFTLPPGPARRRSSPGSGRPRRAGGPLTPIGPTDTVRIVTNDFMFGGGDGYTALAGGTDVLQPGDDLLDRRHRVHQPPTRRSGPVVDGRIVGP